MNRRPETRRGSARTAFATSSWNALFFSLCVAACGGGDGPRDEASADGRAVASSGNSGSAEAETRRPSQDDSDASRGYARRGGPCQAAGGDMDDMDDCGIQACQCTEAEHQAFRIAIAARSAREERRRAEAQASRARAADVRSGQAAERRRQERAFAERMQARLTGPCQEWMGTTDCYIEACNCSEAQQAEYESVREDWMNSFE